jgi:hypothetical protein
MVSPLIAIVVLIINTLCEGAIHGTKKFFEVAYSIVLQSAFLFFC